MRFVDELPEEAGAPCLFGCLAFGGFIVGIAVAALLWWLSDVFA